MSGLSNFDLSSFYSYSPINLKFCVRQINFGSESCQLNKMVSFEKIGKNSITKLLAQLVIK